MRGYKRTAALVSLPSPIRTPRDQRFRNFLAAPTATLQVLSDMLPEKDRQIVDVPVDARVMKEVTHG